MSLSLQPEEEKTTSNKGWIKAPASLVFSLPPELLATFLRIRFYDRGQGCWASLATIGAGLVGERQVRRHIRDLERRGLIRVVNRESQTSLIYCCEKTGTPQDICSTPRRTYRATKPGHQLPVKQISKSKIDPINYNQGESSASQPTEVVVSSDSGSLLSFELPEDLAQLPRKRKGIGVAVIRRLTGEYGINAVRQAVAVVIQQYPDDSRVKSFGALLSTAVREGWRSPTLDSQAAQEAKQSKIIASTPPRGTRWAKSRDGGSIVEVIEISDDLVKTSTGVIPRHAWPEWEWLITTNHNEEAHKPQEAPLNTRPVSIDKESVRRGHLARFAARCSPLLSAAIRSTPERLELELNRAGLTVEDLILYINSQPAALDIE